MPYTGDPSASDAERVRFYAGDTDPNEQLLTESEVEFALTVEGAVLPAAALCLEMLARRYARQVSYSEGGVSESLNQRADAFAARAAELRDRATLSSVRMVTGQSTSSEAAFTRDLHSDTPT